MKPPIPLRAMKVFWRKAVRTMPAAFILAVLLTLPALLLAQQKAEAGGDYAGEIGPQEATLHLKLDPAGALSGTLDHLDPAAPWMFTLAAVHLDGQRLSFTIPSVGASWTGAFSNDGSRLTGTWSQKGGSLLVSFVRVKFIPADKPSPVDGIWLGVIPADGAQSTRVQLVVKSDSAGRAFCTMDALDLYYMDLRCANAAFKDGDFSFDVPVSGEHWSGKLAADGRTLAGNLTAKLIKDGQTQNLVQPLTMERQSALTPEKARPVATYDAAMAPVAAANLEAVLAGDLAGALKSGELAPATGSGVSIGVVEHGVSRVFSFGAAKPDSIFEIGSITKTFTGLLLAQMAAQGKVRLDEPVRELLPPGTAAKPEGGEITLLDLATQRSGLPPMPDNIAVDNLDNPYADYRAANLYAYLRKRGVANPAHVSSPFGSLGFGLLGVALADRADRSYGDLLEGEIAGPLGLKDTVLALTDAQQARMIAGHDQYHGPAKPWDSDALGGAIGLRSTAGDMLAYLEANLHPDTLKAAPSAEGATLPAALRLALRPRAETSAGMQIALGWLYEAETGNYWHNGATAACSSYAFFNPQGDYAAVVLLNASPGVNGSFVEVLGRHISQRLAGKPAISLTNLQVAPGP